MILVRALAALPEFEEAVRLQKTIWGFEEIELLPKRLFVVASKVGGQVFGAFDGTRMVGFALAIPGLKPAGRTYLHSHMVGVLAEYRNQGVGKMLKLKQFEEATSRGVELMEWTFDPLELKNAFFNIDRLGAVVSRYVLNQYGATSSPLHGGLPTDRCIAEWWISSERVTSVLAGKAIPLPDVEASISLPSDISEIRRLEPKKAREIQLAVSEQFLRHFQNGLAVIGFSKTDATGTYLLGKWDFKSIA